MSCNRAARLAALVSCAIAVAGADVASAGTVVQTVHFDGATPRGLYDLYLSAKSHAGFTGNPVTIVRGENGKEVARAREGDEIRAFGGALNATVLRLVPGKMIVLGWKNFAWGMAVNKEEATDLESIVVLLFRKTRGGAQIELVHSNVPDYTVRLPDGETGALSALVNTHWNTLYWDKLRAYLARTKSARPRR